jgi:hypothetical protein
MGYTAFQLSRDKGKPYMKDISSADLSHFSVHEHQIQQALGRVKVRDVDYADIFFE